MEELLQGDARARREPLLQEGPSCIGYREDRIPSGIAFRPTSRMGWSCKLTLLSYRAQVTVAKKQPKKGAEQPTRRRANGLPPRRGAALAWARCHLPGMTAVMLTRLSFVSFSTVDSLSSRYDVKTSIRKLDPAAQQAGR